MGQQVMTITVVFCLMALVVTCLQEIFPLWASSSVNDGGLDFDTSRIGLSPTHHTCPFRHSPI